MDSHLNMHQNQEISRFSPLLSNHQRVSFYSSGAASQKVPFVWFYVALILSLKFGVT